MISHKLFINSKCSLYPRWIFLNISNRESRFSFNIPWYFGYHGFLKIEYSQLCLNFSKIFIDHNDRLQITFTKAVFFMIYPYLVFLWLSSAMGIFSLENLFRLSGYILPCTVTVVKEKISIYNLSSWKFRIGIQSERIRMNPYFLEYANFGMLLASSWHFLVCFFQVIITSELLLFQNMFRNGSEKYYGKAPIQSNWILFHEKWPYWEFLYIVGCLIENWNL